MKKRSVKIRGIALFILLSATALLVMQLSGGGRLTASDSDELMTEAVVSSRVTAEHPPVEIVEKRDDHTRIWEIVREVETSHPDGSTRVETVKSYIHEKASGLCYKDAGGNYVPSIAEWRETPEGFVIDRCPYRLVMGKTIGTSARYTVEGNDLLLRPAYLIISDGVNEADPRLLTPQTPGSISPDNPSILRFPSAFGEGYGLEYVVEKGGFHQNLIIANPPQIPAGFDSQSTSIHLYTELNLDQYLSACGGEVTVEGEPANATAADLVTEPSRGGCISFNKDGRLLHAFSVSQVTDSSGPGALDKQTTAEKRLMKDPASRKSYLVESLPLSYFAEKSPTYPITWDYVQKSGTLNNDETWCPRYTYYVSSTLTIATGRTLTIEPGTVVKLKGQSTQIAVSGKLIAVGEPYNYVSFTSAHDDDCGEDLDGPGKPLPEASPQEGDYYAAFVLASGEVTLRDSQAQYCKVGYGTSGAVATVSPYEMGHDIRDCIFRKCTSGLVLCAPTDSEGPAAVRNNLFFDVGVAITLYGSSYLGIYNNTFDGPGKASDRGVWFWGTANGVQIKYNIFTNLNDAIDNGTISTPIIQHNAFYQTPSEGGPAVLLGATPFESSTGLGDHYLNKGGAGQACRVGGWTARPHDVGLGDRRYTVNKPIPANANITESVSWNIIDNALNESAVALGYHHNRVDYNITTDVTVSPHPETGAKTVLTICPAVVVCVGDTSIQRTLKAHQGCTITCVGNPQQQGYNVITTCPTASMNLRSKTLSTGYPGVVKVDSTASAGCRFAYTRFLRKTRLYLYGKCSSPIDSNRFEYAYYGLYKTVPAEIRNNLFYACLYGVYSSGDADGHTLSCSNTFDHCDLGYAWSTGASSPSTTLRDCLFSKCLYGIYASVLGGAALEESYNAFWKIDSAKYWKNGQTQPLHLTDVSLDPLECPYDRPPGNYGDGPKENDASWYLDQTADWKIVDVGSCDSIDVGLDIFTTAANYKPDFGIGDARTLDIGYHFPMAPPFAMMHPGTGQTDLALYYHGMTEGCLRAFGLDGDAADRMGNQDGTGNVSYGYVKYNPHSGPYNPFQDGEGYHLKYDYHKCALFNGTSSRVDCGSACDIDRLGYTAPQQDPKSFTVSAWVYVVRDPEKADPAYNQIAEKDGENTGWEMTCDGWYDADPAPNKEKWYTRLFCRVCCASGNAYRYSTYTVPNSLWAHVGVVYRDESKDITIYINGVQETSGGQAGSGRRNDDWAYSMNIGARKNGGAFDRYFKGRVADVFVYDRALSEEDVKSLALNGNLDADPEAEWLVTPNLGAMGGYNSFPLGQMNHASFAVQDSEGNIWVSEFGSPGVTKLDNDGNVLFRICPEFVTNGGFEDSASGWTGQALGGGTGSVVRCPTLGYQSIASLQVTHNNQAGSYAARQGPVTLRDLEANPVPNHPYTFSSWVYVLPGAVPSEYAKLRTEGLPQNVDVEADLEIVGQWQKLSQSVIVPEDRQTPVTLYLEVATRNQADGIVYFDEVSVTEAIPSKGTENGRFYGPWGLDVDTACNVYICDEGNSRVQKFDKHGKHLNTWDGSEGGAAGKFYVNYYLCVDATRNYVYVADSGNKRIQKFTLGGGGITAWGEPIDGPHFSGEGQNDMDTYDGILYSDIEDRTYRVEITAQGSAADTFEWTDGDVTDTETIDLDGDWQHLSHDVYISFASPTGHTPGDYWTFDRNPSQFYELQGITTDENGNVWVIDRGEGADRTTAKRFTQNGAFQRLIYRDYSPSTPDFFSHGMDYCKEGNNEYLFTCCGELSGAGTYHFKYNADTGDTVMRWGEDGSLPGQNWSGHGACITPTSPHTFLTSDWFCCRLQEWTLDGRWIRTLQNHLRSDAQSLKCKNKSGQSQILYQTVHLDAGSYTIEFLAFTDGNDVTDDDVEPYAPGNPTGTYEDYVLTTVETTPQQSMWACRVSATFTVGASGSYDIGAEVKAGKSVYIASLTCFRN